MIFASSIISLRVTTGNELPPAASLNVRSALCNMIDLSSNIGAKSSVVFYELERSRQESGLKGNKIDIRLSCSCLGNLFGILFDCYI